MIERDGGGPVARDEAYRERAPFEHFVAGGGYRVLEGCIGEDYRSRSAASAYYPMVAPAALTDFMRIGVGDTNAAVEFYDKWGALGFESFAMRATYPESFDFDPLPWIWAHANGLRVAVDLIRLVREERIDEIRSYLDAEMAPNLHHQEKGRPSAQYWISAELPRWAERAQLLSAHAALGHEYQPEDPPASIHIEAALELFTMRDTWVPGILTGHGVDLVLDDEPRSRGFSPGLDGGATAVVDTAFWLITGILNPHLSGTFPQVRTAPQIEWHDDSGPLPADTPFARRFDIVRSFDSLLSVLYLHAFNLLTGARLRSCKECGTPFVPSRANQEYCPPDPRAGSSGCRNRRNQRAFRERRRRAVENSQ